MKKTFVKIPALFCAAALSAACAQAQTDRYVWQGDLYYIDRIAAVLDALEGR